MDVEMTIILNAPIQLVTGSDLLALCDSEYLKVFDKAPWDEYLLRQHHIEYLQTAFWSDFSRNFSFSAGEGVFTGLCSPETLGCCEAGSAFSSTF
ncbi:hypothetical protein [Endozoicomonas acroporae]|uniref:hypothetical protein n=1 Tax=Endozoicomonas acroporae TaxID=1701104 RepID=UPI003D797A3D